MPCCIILIKAHTTATYRNTSVKCLHTLEITEKPAEEKKRGTKSHHRKNKIPNEMEYFYGCMQVYVYNNLPSVNTNV